MGSHEYRYIVAAVDAVLVAVCMIAAYFLRFSLPFVSDPGDQFGESLVVPVLPFIAAAWLVSLLAHGAYRDRQWGAGVDEYREVMYATITAIGAITVAAYLFHYPLSHGYVAALFVVGIPVLILGRYAARRLLHWARRRGRMITKVLVAGNPAPVQDLVTILDRESWLGYRPIGLLLTDPEAPTSMSLPVLGSPDNVVDVIEQSHAAAVVFTTGSFARGNEFNEVARRLESHAAKTIVVPALSDVSAQRMRIRPVAGIPIMHVDKPTAEHALSASKRFFDVVVSSIIIVILSPVMLITAIAVRADGGPVIFKQPRVGQGGRMFDCLKFRSMVVNAEQVRAHHLELSNESDGVLFKIKDDPRITRVGKLIRRFSIDELPQLFNVVRGDMSLVGPRPALSKEVALYKSHVLRRLDVRPGITGLWQVSGRSDLSWDETVRLDLYYVDNWSMIQDLVILVKTVRAVLGSRGAY